MKKDIVVNLLEKCDLTCEIEQNGEETVIYGYNDELQFEVYVIVEEARDGIYISTPLTPDIENVTDEAMNLINDFYANNETMVDVLIDECLITEISVCDAKEKDIEYYLSEYMNFYADESNIAAINKIINKIAEDNN